MRLGRLATVLCVMCVSACVSFLYSMFIVRPDHLPSGELAPLLYMPDAPALVPPLFPLLLRSGLWGFPPISAYPLLAMTSLVLLPLSAALLYLGYFRDVGEALPASLLILANPFMAALVKGGMYHAIFSMAFMFLSLSALRLKVHRLVALSLSVLFSVMSLCLDYSVGLVSFVSLLSLSLCDFLKRRPALSLLPVSLSLPLSLLLPSHYLRLMSSVPLSGISGAYIWALLLASFPVMFVLYKWRSWPRLALFISIVSSPLLIMVLSFKLYGLYLWPLLVLPSSASLMLSVCVLRSFGSFIRILVSPSKDERDAWDIEVGIDPLKLASAILISAVIVQGLIVHVYFAQGLITSSMGRSLSSVLDLLRWICNNVPPNATVLSEAEPGLWLYVMSGRRVMMPLESVPELPGLELPSSPAVSSLLTAYGELRNAFIRVTDFEPYSIGRAQFFSIARGYDYVDLFYVDDSYARFVLDHAGKRWVESPYGGRHLDGGVVRLNSTHACIWHSFRTPGLIINKTVIINKHKPEVLILYKATAAKKDVEIRSFRLWLWILWERRLGGKRIYPNGTVYAMLDEGSFKVYPIGDASHVELERDPLWWQLRVFMEINATEGELVGVRVRFLDARRSSSSDFLWAFCFKDLRDYVGGNEVFLVLNKRTFRALKHLRDNPACRVVHRNADFVVLRIRLS